MRSWLDVILSEANMENAMRHTVQKNTSAGVDKVTAHQLKLNWIHRKDEIIKSIYKGDYYPLPARRVFINKGNGKKRKLTILAMQDRMIQRCIVNVLGEYYEQYFHENSFGFRKGRGTDGAIEKVISYMDAGLDYIIDLDIKNFFDTISHTLLMELLKKSIDDDHLLVLIKRYLKVNVFCGRKIIRTHRGVAQGGPISSLLANIVLNELDWYLDKRGFLFIRYADDVVIFCNTMDEAQQTLDIVKSYLNEQLRLCVNMEKTKILKSEDLVFLGMAFEKKDQKHKLVLNERIKQRMVARLQKCFLRSNRKGIELWDALGGFHRGWLNYYCRLSKRELQNWLDDVRPYEDEIMRGFIEKSPTSLQEKQVTLLQSKQYVSFDKWLERMNSDGICK